MKESSDLQEPRRSLAKTLKRAVRRPRKEAPESGALRGWARSALRGRSKA